MERSRGVDDEIQALVYKKYYELIKNGVEHNTAIGIIGQLMSGIESGLCSGGREISPVVYPKLPNGELDGDD